MVEIQIIINFAIVGGFFVIVMWQTSQQKINKYTFERLHKIEERLK